MRDQVTVMKFARRTLTGNGSISRLMDNTYQIGSLD